MVHRTSPAVQCMRERGRRDLPCLSTRNEEKSNSFLLRNQNNAIHSFLSLSLLCAFFLPAAVGEGYKRRRKSRGRERESVVVRENGGERKKAIMRKGELGIQRKDSRERERGDLIASYLSSSGAEETISLYFYPFSPCLSLMAFFLLSSRHILSVCCFLPLCHFFHISSLSPVLSFCSITPVDILGRGERKREREKKGGKGTKGEKQ